MFCVILRIVDVGFYMAKQIYFLHDFVVFQEKVYFCINTMENGIILHWCSTETQRDSYEVTSHQLRVNLSTAH